VPESKEQEAYVRKFLHPNTYSIIVILLSIPRIWPILSKQTNQCSDCMDWRLSYLG